jgi:hypothetical protein
MTRLAIATSSEGATMIGNASQRLSAQPFPIFLPLEIMPPSQAYSAIIFDLVAGILVRAG